MPEKSPLRAITTRRVGSSGFDLVASFVQLPDFATKYMGGNAIRAKKWKSALIQNGQRSSATIADYVGREACVGFNVASALASRRAG